MPVTCGGQRQRHVKGLRCVHELHSYDLKQWHGKLNARFKRGRWKPEKPGMGFYCAAVAKALLHTRQTAVEQCSA